MSRLAKILIPVLGIPLLCGGCGLFFLHEHDAAFFGPPIEKGMTLADVGRLRPGHYFKNSDSLDSFPRATTGLAKRHVGFNSVLVLRTRRGEKGSIPFTRGRRTEFPSFSMSTLPRALKARFPLGMPLSAAVVAVPSDVDARLIREGSADRGYDLPRDESMLPNFTGWIQGSSLSTSRVYAWKITFSKGLVTGIIEKAEFGDFSPQL